MMMKIGSTGLLFASLVLTAACGSSKPRPAQATPPPAVEEAMTPAEEQPSMVVAPDAPEDLGMPKKAEPAPEPAPPPEPAPIVAIANLTAVKGGDAMGQVMFEQAGGDSTQVMINGKFNGLSPGKHAFYIYEKGDCTAGLKGLGTHLNPTKAKHGPPSSSKRHVGDFGNVEIDAEGNGTFTMTTDSLTMTTDGRPDSVIQRALVVHAKADDKKGSGGAIVACGVITMREE
jgi:Cu-Zn family superoxide dismutase